MLNRKHIQFLVAFFGILALGWGAFGLLLAQEEPRAAQWVAGIGTGLAYLWLLWGFWLLREFRAAKAAMALMIGGVIAGALALFLFRVDQPIYGAIVIAIYSMSTAFIVGLWLIRVGLSPGNPVTGVARTLIDESIRMKIVVILIIGALLLVPIQIVITATEPQLRYRIQSFLTYSLGGMSLLLSLMTMFLACWSVTAEIEKRQIFLSMTKAVSRGQYLMGKWIGISLLNLLLVVIVGTGVYSFSKVMQYKMVPYTRQDAIAVHRHLMVAREARKPSPPPELNLRAQLDQKIADMREDRARTGGAELTPKDFRDAEMEIYTKWHTIGPGESVSFIFKDLNAAFKYGAIAQLRLTPKMGKQPEDEMARMALWINERPVPYDFRAGGHESTKIAVKTPHIINIPLAEKGRDKEGNEAYYSLLNQDGSLKLTIKNIDLENPGVTPISSITFAPSDGIEMLYIVDKFEYNLIRTLTVLWLRLVFLAILGITAGTFLGFPVACLLCLMVYFTAISSSFINESLGYYAGTVKKDAGLHVVLGTLITDMITSVKEAKWGHLVKEMVRFFAELGLSLIPSFGEYNPVTQLADGRNVSYRYVGEAFLWIAVIWSGLCAWIGWLIFKRRELARIIA